MATKKPMFVPPQGFAGFAQTTPATQRLLGGRSRPRTKKKRAKKKVTKTRTRKKTAKKKTSKRPAKGSAAMKRKMAKLRAMRK